MSLLECKRAKEVQTVLASGHWPEACPVEVREHVESCSQCADMVLVAKTLRKIRASSMQVRPVSSPSLLWWKAQLRQRQQAMEKVRKPVFRAQIVAMIVAVCVAATFAAQVMRSPRAWGGWAGDASMFGAAFRSFFGGLGPLTLATVLIMLMMMGAALAYAAFGRE